MSHIQQLLSTGEEFAPPASVRAWAPIPSQDDWTAAARENPERFWHDLSTHIAWESAPTEVLHGKLGDARWFVDGRLNATVSCLDRHVRTHPSQVAYHFVCENGTTRDITYRDLLAEVARLANALRADGVEKGDRVCIYMPLTIEGIVAMLACARIGAVHSVVYAGLGATALRDRIEDAQAEVVLAADVTYRRGKPVDLKAIVEDAVAGTNAVRRIVWWRRETKGTRLGRRER
ncbi:MAG: AMP-binding protein, partial [Candidatus Eremiobacteraeota bacterium]|nr:AMP-binding protein [Candidatus Eremiobacteraeota bacterium]